MRASASGAAASAARLSLALVRAVTVSSPVSRPPVTRSPSAPSSAPSPPRHPRPRRAIAPAPSLSGSGLFTLPDTATLAPGRFTLGLALDNRDRDPLGLDLFDYVAGVGRGRDAAAGGLRPVGVQPRGVDAGAARAAAPAPRPGRGVGAARRRARTTRSTPAVPYVNKRGTARFDAFVPGRCGGGPEAAAGRGGRRAARPSRWAAR